MLFSRRTFGDGAAAATNIIMSRLLVISAVFVVVALAWTYCAVTPTEQCSGHQIVDLRERIEVKPCGKSKCKLRKGTNVTVNFKFNPESDVKQLRNHVFANIAGLPLPFVGVDGVSACKDIRKADGTPATCPLKPNEEYFYTNTFHVETFYPSVSLKVHWALNDGQKDIICFEVPATIL